MSALWLAWRTRVLGFLAAAGAVLVALGAVFRAGARSERGRQDRASLDNLRDRTTIDDQISRRPLDDVRSELNRWVRDDDRTR
jgi:hypothetical protein